MIDSQTFQLAEETQKIILAILIVGWIILWEWKWLVATAGWFGVTALVRGFADVPSEHHTILLPGDPNGLPPGVTIYIVLCIDLAFIFLLVMKTGGSELSPFTPLYFMLPVFALLILGAEYKVYVFSGAAICVFIFSLFFSGDKLLYCWISPDYVHEVFVRRHRFASLWISLACLSCVIFIDVRKPILEAQMAQRRTTIPAGKQLPSEKRDAPLATINPLPSPAALVEQLPNSNPALTPTASATPSLDSSPSIKRSRTNQHASILQSYPVFLKYFYSAKLTEKQRASFLKAHRGRQVDWEVKFEYYEGGKDEIHVYFSRADGRPLPQPPPVRLAKLSKNRAAFIERLSHGQVVNIIGRLERHSASELFVQAFDIH